MVWNESEMIPPRNPVIDKRIFAAVDPGVPQSRVKAACFYQRLAPNQRGAGMANEVPISVCSNTSPAMSRPRIFQRIRLCSSIRDHQV